MQILVTRLSSLVIALAALAASADPASNNPVGVGIGAPGPVFGEGVTPDPNLMFVWDEALWVGVLYSSSIVVADIDFSVLAGDSPGRPFRENRPGFRHERGNGTESATSGCPVEAPSDSLA